NNDSTAITSSHSDAVRLRIAGASIAAGRGGPRRDRSFLRLSVSILCATRAIVERTPIERRERRSTIREVQTFSACTAPGGPAASSGGAGGRRAGKILGDA